MREAFLGRGRKGKPAARKDGGKGGMDPMERRNRFIRLNKILLVGLIFGTLAAGTLGGPLSGLSLEPAHANGLAPGTEIQVSGEAQLTVNPDMATATLAVESQAPTAPEAQEDNARRTQNIVDALVASGIKKEAISTTNFRLYPVWEQQRQPSPSSTSAPQPPKIIGYRVSHDLVIKVDDIDRLGEILDIAVNAGADRVSSIDFGIREAGRYRATLLQDAFRDAQAKAEALAAAAGLVLLGPSHINEGGFSPYAVRSTARLSFDVAAATEILPGEQQLSARVDVTFVAARHMDAAP